MSLFYCPVPGCLVRGDSDDVAENMQKSPSIDHGATVHLLLKYAMLVRGVNSLEEE